MGNLNKAPWWVLLNKSMLDTDLADLYGYEVKRLNEQVKRNIRRFLEDFRFQLNESEIPERLKSQ